MGRLMLARQIDHVVGEVERDFVEREVRVLDFLRIHDVAVAVVACERGGSIRAYKELPELKLLGGNSLVVGLNEGDFVQEPIGSGGVRNVLRAVRKKHLAIDTVPIPLLGTGDRTTVRGRARYSAKPAVWDCLNQLSKTHCLIVAEIEVEQRLTRELLADIESLLIFEIQPCCNVQNTASRGKHGRAGMRVECCGKAWPLSRKVYWDE